MGLKWNFNQDRWVGFVAGFGMAILAVCILVSASYGAVWPAVGFTSFESIAIFVLLFGHPDEGVRKVKLQEVDFK